MYEVKVYTHHDTPSKIESFLQKISKSDDKKERALYIKLHHKLNVLEYVGTQFKNPTITLKDKDKNIYQLLIDNYAFFFQIQPEKKLIILLAVATTPSEQDKCLEESRKIVQTVKE